MRYFKSFAWLALAAGIALTGASSAYGQGYYRDLRHDQERVERLRADIARDQWRLNEALRSGRRWEAERISRDLARDQRALDAQLRDIRRDRHYAWGYR